MARPGDSEPDRADRDVSRETPDAPPAARVLFGARLPTLERYAGLLADAGVSRGLLGPREVPRLWERHLLNCAVLSDAIPEGASVADLGSGAGLPGLVLAIRRPDLRVTLVESLLRRSTFLSEVVAELELAGVEVVRVRAEELHGSHVFDVVTSRAVAPLPRLLAWSMPLVSPDGALVAMKGAAVEQEIADAAGVLQRLRCATPEVLELGGEVLSSPTRVVRVAWSPAAQVGWAGSTGRRRGGSRRPELPGSSGRQPRRRG